MNTHPDKCRQKSYLTLPDSKEIDVIYIVLCGNGFNQEGKICSQKAQTEAPVEFI